jgi:hypothetical protein
LSDQSVAYLAPDQPINVQTVTFASYGGDSGGTYHCNSVSQSAVAMKLKVVPLAPGADAAVDN